MATMSSTAKATNTAITSGSTATVVSTTSANNTEKELTWRTDSLFSYSYYVKKFALLPITTDNGERIWFKTYYLKRRTYKSVYSGVTRVFPIAAHHIDDGILSENEYLLEKLVS